MLGELSVQLISKISNTYGMWSWSGWSTPTFFHPNFGAISVAPDRPCWGQWAHNS